MLEMMFEFRCNRILKLFMVLNLINRFLWNSFIETRENVW